jgi:hypothetical protein
MRLHQAMASVFERFEGTSPGTAINPDGAPRGLVQANANGYKETVKAVDRPFQ